MGGFLRSWPRRGRSLGAVGLAALLLAACGSSGSGASASAPGGPTAAPSVGATPATAANGPASTGPAAFQLTVAGDPNVIGTWTTSYGINCNNPTFDGYDILFFAQSPDTKAVVLITLDQGSLAVSERAGAGAAYTDREFQGTGVTAFDPARGASFAADLSIVPTPRAPSTGRSTGSGWPATTARSTATASRWWA